MASSQGYKCEFIEDSVSEDFLCKKCNLVAKRLTLTSCCGESFCQTCVVDTQEQGQLCPVCGEKEFTFFQHVKNQKRINKLQVHCIMKERGCVWSGTLDQLDTHLDPHLGNCQYVDTKCPLNCLQNIPKNKVDQHVTQECTKRPHVCQHCGFKATYEEVVDTHLPECKYVALQCPNMCGVSCECEVMEDHMKICRLEEVECQFSSVGCDGWFVREDQDEHARQNSQKHLTLTTSLVVNIKKDFQRKMEKQEHKIQEQERVLKEQEKRLEQQEKTLEQQEKTLGEQEKTLGEQEKTLGKQEKTLEQQEKTLEQQEKTSGEQEKRLGKQEKTLVEQQKTLEQQENTLGEQLKKLEEKDKEITELKFSLQENQQRVSDLFNMIVPSRKFEMKNFSLEKAKNKRNDWMSPAMYTHLCGYKFCIGVDANRIICGTSFVAIDVWSIPGEFDKHLTWPKNLKLIIELINQQGGKNATYKSSSLHLRKTNNKCRLDWHYLVENLKTLDFLANDTLYFHVSKIEVLT